MPEPEGIMAPVKEKPITVVEPAETENSASLRKKGTPGKPQLELAMERIHTACCMAITLREPYQRSEIHLKRKIYRLRCTISVRYFMEPNPVSPQQTLTTKIKRDNKNMIIKMV